MADQKTPAKVYNIVAFTFADQKRAGQIANEIKAAGKDAGYKTIVEAVVERDMSGNVHYYEPGKGGVGAVAGAAVGGVLAILFAPAALLGLAIAGAIGGGVAGHLAGRAIPAEDLKRFGDHMPTNSSAFLLMLEDTEAEKAIDSLKDYNAKVVTMVIGDEASGEIDAAIAAEVDKVGGDKAPAAAPADAKEIPATSPKASTDKPADPAKTA
jgi:uncharacterized membrane protein